jgi:hypothetical protein
MSKIIPFNPKSKGELVHACDCGGVLFYIGKENYIERYRCGMKTDFPEFKEEEL